MNFKISYTDTFKQSPYPLHRHKNHEIIYYFSGRGLLKTDAGCVNVVPNSIAVVPPETNHTLTTPENCIYIALAGDFDYSLHFTSTVLLNDNAEKDGGKLIDMIYRNYISENEYLQSLIDSYVRFVMCNTSFSKDIDSAVSEIMHNISVNFFDYDINMKKILRSSGYAEDYIRAIFKKITGMTPNEYLSKVRMNHACYLIDVYGDAMSLTEIALSCGYCDYTYFSQKFRKIFGVSPRDYKKTGLPAGI